MLKSKHDERRRKRSIKALQKARKLLEEELFISASRTTCRAMSSIRPRTHMSTFVRHLNGRG